MNDVVGKFFVFGHFSRLVVPLFDIAACSLSDLKLGVHHIAMVAAPDVTLLFLGTGVWHCLRLRVPGPDLRRHIAVLGFPARVSEARK
jgi:hypothetical protein